MSTKKLQILGSFGTNVEVDSTLTQPDQAADAKVVGDAISNLNTLVGDTAVAEQIDTAIENLSANFEEAKNYTDLKTSEKASIIMKTWTSNDMV